MLTNPVPDFDQAAGHPHLAEMLTGDQDPHRAHHLNSLVVRRYAQAVRAAMQLPAGEPRQAVLRALSSAVGAHLSNAALQDDVKRLRTRLASEMPDAQRLEEGHAKVGVFLRKLGDAFKKAWASDVAKGVDLSRSSMAWFEHELLTYSPAIAAAVRAMVISGTPKPVETPNAPAVEKS